MAITQWQAITDELRKRIESGELEPGAKLASEVTIAAEWGVSRQTAHRSLHELQRLGFVSRQRRWGTVVAPRSSQQTGRVALVVDVFSQAYGFPSADLLRGLQDGLGDAIDVICRECRRDPEQEARLLRKLQAENDGIIVYPTANPKNTPLLQKIADTHPLVVLDRVPPGLDVDAVVSDNREATLGALQAMQAKGHERIGFFSFNRPSYSSVEERFHAYRSAMHANGGLDPCAYVRWFPNELDANHEQFVQSVYDALFTLMHQANPITALFCVQDSFAAASLQACDRMGKTVPEDLELATFNDWPAMMLRSPWLTHRIVQNDYQIGLTAARLLSARIAGSTKPRQLCRVHAEFFVAEAGAQVSPPAVA